MGRQMNQTTEINHVTKTAAAASYNMPLAVLSEWRAAVREGLATATFPTLLSALQWGRPLARARALALHPLAASSRRPAPQPCSMKRG